MFFTECLLAKNAGQFGHKKFRFFIKRKTFYHAPIDEAGNATPKYYAIRNLLSKYLLPGETLPEVPAATTAQCISSTHHAGFIFFNADFEFRKEFRTLFFQAAREKISCFFVAFVVRAF